MSGLSTCPRCANIRLIGAWILSAKRLVTSWICYLVKVYSELEKL